MRRLSMIMVSLLAMMAVGSSLKAQEVTITLSPGYTWISYLGTEPQDFATALGSFTPEVGDVIKSQVGNATYLGNGQWRGSITQFYPGCGYMYKSTRMEPVTITMCNPILYGTVTTTHPTDITTTSAVVGGTVTIGEGNHIYARGVCWGTEIMPTINGNHISNDAETGNFTDTLTGLTPGTNYYVRAYVVTDYGLAYGEELNFTTPPIGAIDGLFSVSDSRQVYFSQGNLQYIGSASTPYWKFADYQWDCFGDNGQGSESHYIDRDLFGWGTSGYNHGAICYQPWSTSENNTDYNPYGDSNTDLFDQTGQADWGYNAISNGGNQENQWRTLDYFEWNYLLDTRNTLSGIRFALAQVNNVNGVILLPDNWNENIYYLNNTNQHVSNFNNNIITSSAWNILEKAGAVFMPVTGSRYGTSIGSLNESIYWTSSRTNENGAFGLLVSDSFDGFIAIGYSFRSHGYAVRLVRNKPVPLPEVSTLEPANITSTTATVGGSVSNNVGIEITECGICWSTEQNPTIEGDHIIAEDVTLGEFTIELTDLLPSTVYYVRAYVVSNQGVAYGEEVNFTTLYENGGSTHEYVDLGLPSGLLWATCNVGADTPEDYGDYFAWGEISPKDYYYWSTYHYCNGSSNTLTKYCNNSNYGYNGFTDDLTTLLPEDDVATANWGEDWRMPTMSEWQELFENTTGTWITTANGVVGRIFTASNGNSIFIPAAGRSWQGENNHFNIYGYYWSSSLCDEGPQASAWGYDSFNSSNYGMWANGRANGQSVRPVRSPSQSNAPTGAINGKFTINEDGDQVYFSQGNLQYQASTNTWQFAENQWDYVGTQYPDSYGAFGGTIIGSDNSNISESYNGWIDLFGWGTSGYNHGAICYQPWSTSRNTSDYYVYGDITYNLFDQTGQAEWGYNPISNGGNMENSGWRTLTDDEWTYIMSLRSTISGVLFAKGQVNGHKGVFIFPDDWSSANYAISNKNGGTFSSNIISLDDWINVLEPQGVVFLPAAGMRDAVSVVNVNICGYYYCSTSTGFGANNVHFNNGYLWTEHTLGRTKGQSVRLVQLVQ